MNLSSPINLLIAGIYFLLVLVLSFFSVFGVYVLVRYAQSRMVALGVSLLYGFFYLTILSASYSNLQQILK
ncbi:MAG: hypothetical protein M1400_01710 [Patescibacteria group bacterium]|nr:hypothetical protein [Patescibacteria group bacterium]